MLTPAEQEELDRLESLIFALGVGELNDDNWARYQELAKKG